MKYSEFIDFPIHLLSKKIVEKTEEEKEEEKDREENSHIEEN